MVRSENTDTMDHDDSPILDEPSTSRQAAEAAAVKEAVPPANNASEVEDIMVKWGKAMKTACEAQKLLQDVMEEMSHQMRTNNGHRWKRQRRAEGIGKIGQRRAGRHCRPTHHEDDAEAPLQGQYIEIISSENSSDSSSDTGDSVVEIISYQEEAPHHMNPYFGHHRRFHHHHSHHGGTDRSHSRGRDRRRSRSRSRSHSRGHSGSPSCGNFRHCWEHMMRQSHYHHPQHPYPHPHPHHHPHHHHPPHHGYHHHHPPHHGYHHHHPQHPQTNSSFYNYASNQSAGGASIRTIVDTLPLALTL